MIPILFCGETHMHTINQWKSTFRFAMCPDKEEGMILWCPTLAVGGGAIFLLFCLERVLLLKQKKSKNNKKAFEGHVHTN